MTVMTAPSPSNVSTTGGSIKKMIRDTSRLLNRPNLPADLRREQERKLAALQVALADRVQAETEREMATKYRMVKFFERKKALRHLASAQAKNSPAAVSEAQLDLAYILHFPKDRKYISLYSSSESGESVVAERDSIRKQIAEKLALLGAEVMLAKVTKVKTSLKGSDDEESGSEEESGSDDEESGSDSDNDDSDSDGSDNDGSESGSDDDGLSYDEDSDDLDSDNDNEEESSADDDSENEEDFDSEGESNSDESGDSEDDDSDDEDSEDEDSDSEDEEEESESESEEDQDAPKAKKGRH